MTVMSMGAGRAVLAVANDPVVRALGELLEASGYGVIRSAPVVSAAEILRHRPSVVLMDISPDHRDLALRTVEDLRRRERRLPIILVGTDGSAATLISALRAGVKNFFTSPFSVREVGAAICACAGEAAARLYVNALNALAHSDGGLDAVLHVASSARCFTLTTAGLPETCELVGSVLKQV